MMSFEPVVLDGSPLRVEDVRDVALRRRKTELRGAVAFVNRIEQGADVVRRLLKADGVIYGVTTGYGDSCNVVMPTELTTELGQHLYRYHGCGLGALLEPEVVRAVMVARLQSLCQGYSGVRFGLLESIATLLRHDILPIIPEEGSVGASGDLTPLSYLAAVLSGERDVWHNGARRKTAAVFRELGIEPVILQPKEGLAIMNGTAVMTAQACLAYVRADYLARLATRISAMVTLSLQGNAHHFDGTLFSVKPHPGQQEIARRLREDLRSDQSARNERRLQDRYSIRCAPHIIGVLQDALPWLRQLIENELNSANDNPLIDPATGRVLHGGHFYGGHVAMAMDTLKTAVANLADLLDRQLALMVDSRFSHGLPPNLSGAGDKRAAINHGLKAVQISVSAWTAEALKLTMPASVFSRSTECHNQDKVSMGSIAAREGLRVLQLVEQVCAALLIAVRQALELRVQEGVLSSATLAAPVAEMLDDLRQMVDFVSEDRALEPELRRLVAAIQQTRWTLYG